MNETEEMALEETIGTKKKVQKKRLDSSLPNTSFEKKTKGFRPRSREASSRMAFLKPTEENRDKIDCLFRKGSFAKTHIPPEWIPEGVTTLWARSNQIGLRDSTNLSELERVQWKYAEPSMFPHLSYMDEDGSVDDSSDVIRNNELILMWRETWIHEMELNKYKKKSLKKQNMVEDLGDNPNFSSDLKPFGRKQSLDDKRGVNETFTSQGKSTRFLNLHE